MKCGQKKRIMFIYCYRLLLL